MSITCLAVTPYLLSGPIPRTCARSSACRRRGSGPVCAARSKRSTAKACWSATRRMLADGALTPTARARLSAASSASSTPRRSGRPGLTIWVEGTAAFDQYQSPSIAAMANFPCVPASEKRAGRSPGAHASGSCLILRIRSAISRSSAGFISAAMVLGSVSAGRRTSPPRCRRPPSVVARRFRCCGRHRRRPGAHGCARDQEEGSPGSSRRPAPGRAALTW